VRSNVIRPWVLIILSSFGFSHSSFDSNGAFLRPQYMRILLASSEVHPYSKTGGLADMVGALGKALARAGHEARIVTPLYHGIRERFPAMRRVDWQFDLPLGARRVLAQLWSLKVEKGLTIYFVDQPDFYERAGLYLENHVSYSDNAGRFIFFSKCVAHLARYLPWRPDLVHVHDWQAAMVPALMLHQRARRRVGNSPPTCLTIHNLAYQGTFPAAAFTLTKFTGKIFQCRRRGVLQTIELPQSRNRLCRCDYNSESALRARNHDPGIRVRTGRIIAPAAEPPFRNSQRRGSRKNGMPGTIRF